MHRPSLRVHARDLNRQAGILKAIMARMHSSMIAGALKGLANRFKRHYGTSKYMPHQGAREKLRRRIGGFARLHDHRVERDSTGMRRCCPVCDLGIPHADLEKAI